VGTNGGRIPVGIVIEEVYIPGFAHMTSFTELMRNW
jgi:hypothetical protein